MRLSFTHSTGVFLSLAVVVATVEVTGAACFEGAKHFHPDDWMYCQPLADGLFLYYTHVRSMPTARSSGAASTIAEGNVMIGFHATQDAFGWSALALAGNGGMKGASQIVVRLNEDDQWIAEDRYSEDYATPSLDEEQDVKLLFADQTDDGETSWGILLPMSSCDIHNYAILDRKTYMHWALGSDHTFSYHGTRRGQFHANLMQAPAELPSTDGLQHMDMVMPNVPVVLGEGGQDPTNPHICTFFDLDVLSEGRYGSGEKIHVTRFSPIIAEESKQYVHHMILYACGPDEDEDDDDAGWDPADAPMEHLSIVPECESMPRGCYEMKFPWAVGSGDVIFPPDVGMPIDQDQKFLVLQVHYYNKNLDEDVTDNSGVRAYFTSELRAQEAGLLQFDAGTSDWQRPPIPAGVAGYQVPPMTVPHRCTNGIWNGPLNVVGVIHHMHLHGTNMEIAVERNGENMGLLRTEHHYDFNHQSLEDPNPALRSLLPGDQITMNCRYDTSTATEDVSFGDLTQQEMCYAAVVYYPRQEEEGLSYMTPQGDASQCTSAATDEQFASFNASRCAQELFENVPRFFDFEDWVPAPFGAMTVCNGGEGFADLLEAIPGLCPGCQSTGNCTEEEVASHAQQYCTVFCPSSLNVTAYPDLSDTEAVDSGTYGCPLDFQFFTTPEMAPPAMCQRVGNLSQDIELQKVEVEASDASPSLSRVSIVLAGIAVMFCIF